MPDNKNLIIEEPKFDDSLGLYRDPSSGRIKVFEDPDQAKLFLAYLEMHNENIVGGELKMITSAGFPDEYPYVYAIKIITKDATDMFELASVPELEYYANAIKAIVRKREETQEENNKE